MKTTRMRSRGKASRSGTPSLDGRLYADCIGGVRRNRNTLKHSFTFFFVIPSLTLYTFSLIFMGLSKL